MIKPSHITQNLVNSFCADRGKDPLFVQGAGGNVSWKEDDVLWIKASGTWLARAEHEEIFIPVDLAHVRTEMAKGNFAVSPRVIGDSILRPSIETLMHALMPQTYVVHLHAVEILSHLVQEEGVAAINALPEQTGPWCVIDYFKPGAELAEAIHAELKALPSTKVLYLKNHGVVIGGDNLEEINNVLDTVTRALAIIPAAKGEVMDPLSLSSAGERGAYVPLDDNEIHQLASDPDYCRWLSSAWALYPDHVVFLGPKAPFFSSWNSLHAHLACNETPPELVFIAGQGAFVLPSFSEAKRLQLRCYYDVIVRQTPTTRLATLNDAQIGELLNWDAEQYRMNISVTPLATK
ncbi:class II aldolase/adducin family protein [Erwinia amylovora]